MSEARHYLLQGFFSHETTLLRSMETGGGEHFTVSLKHYKSGILI